MRRQDTTRISEKTQQLFSIAGAADDPLQALYALPGVTFSDGGEPVIRGSGAEDNIYYIDSVPAQYLFHVFGNSIFNKNLIQRFELHSGAFPSRYGDATGGVIDVTLRDPKHEDFSTIVSASFLLTGVLVEGELNENHAFYASYRRSLLDQFDTDFLTEDEDGVTVTDFPVAQDYQLKHRWDLNDKNSLSFVAAGASDDLEAEADGDNDYVARDPDLAGPVNYEQGFNSQGITWSWASTSSNKESNFILSHIDEYLHLDYGNDQTVNTPADRYVMRFDYGQTASDNHHITTGVSYSSSDYDFKISAKLPVCSDFDSECSTADAELISLEDNVSIDTLNAYFEDEIRLSSRNTISLALHLSQYDYLGKTEFEPRLRWEHEFSDDLKTHIALGQHSQSPELAEMIDGVGNPNLDVVKATHLVLGLEYYLSTNWLFKTEMYYKDLRDVVISINNPSAPDFADKYSNDAEGKAYGIEFFLQRELSDKWYGWASLSLGKTERKDLRSGDTSPFEYDKPIIFNITANYLLSDSWNIGLTWSYQSGALYTPVVGLDSSANDDLPSLLELLVANPTGGLFNAINDLLNQVNNLGAPSPVYGRFNSQRLPDYQRLDLRAEYTRPTISGYWKFYVDLLNAYDHDNVQGYEYSPTDREPLSYTPAGYGENVPVAAEHGIGIFPSLGLEVKF
ncbi:MAG: TonB-dependent receptor plug domain-containing protein [Zhongshania sp.]|uniref:TonB-dependent receptor plug domain-containing protein n=1 Tax=Zhongshania sp. TaxID=1971902 RepID=UPI002635581F|nr:outer membrane beta-barrel protein [Zhongshania sp.]MDF1692725.1 TonB-dependent receptor plug domain-containing protein [Zhongshania sp.]